jgi:diguanylate cyclase (GGDEF)-like protein/PAS domain S-box-containing protein
MNRSRRLQDAHAGQASRWSLRDLAGIGVLVAVLIGGLMLTGLPRRIDAAIYDLLAKTLQHAPDRQILLVTIDEKSLQQIGGWPWPRRTHAAFLDRLAAAGDTTVALDLLLAERDAEPGADAALSDSIRNHGRVILPVVPASLVDAPGLTAVTSLSPITRPATLAHADIDPDPDGVVRRIYLRAGLGTPSLPTLGLALMQARAGIAGETGARPDPSDAQAWVRTDEVLIPFVGPAGTYARASYVDVLEGRVPSAQLRGKYVIVGATAAGLGARFTTPTTLASRLPMTGAELHANVLETLLEGRAITAAATPWALAAALPWLVAGLALLRLTRPHQVLSGSVILFGLAGLCAWLGVRFGAVWVAPAPTLLALLAVYPIWSWRQLRWHMGALFKERGQSHATLELVQDGIITLDSAGRARYLNSAAEAITGRPALQALGRPLDEITGLKPVDAGPALPHSSDGDLMRIATHTLTAPDGTERAVRIARHPLPQDGGSVIAITDVTANLTLARQIRFQATHDNLTGLPNRTILADRLGQTLAAARRRNQSAAVLFIDLDGFKKVNDALGHRAGDLMLREVGERLASRVRAEDTAARWGGDEFVLVLGQLEDEHSAIGFADGVVALLEQPFDLDGQPAFISASIGISLFPRDGEDGDTLLLHADTAMYRAKRGGGRGVGVFSHEVGAWSKARLNLENDLRASLQRGPLDVWYQPIVDLHQGSIAHLEALIRWQHPQQGMQTPDQFLALAESSGLIHDIGTATLVTACADAQKLARQGLAMGVSVNVSPQQLTRGELAARVGEALAVSGLPAERLTLEVTENGIVSDAARAAQTIEQLRRLGVRIALDDFGTGYSSLSLLRDFPIDILKIDRSFVPNPQQGAGDLTIAHAIIGMARNLDKTVIAEGVETAWQSRALLVGGCHLQQGFLHSPPVAISEIPAIARRVALAGAPTLITGY